MTQHQTEALAAYCVASAEYRDKPDSKTLAAFGAACTRAAQALQVRKNDLDAEGTILAGRLLKAMDRPAK